MQTARGASLNGAHESHAPRQSRWTLGILLGIAAAVWAADQATKMLALERLTPHEAVPVVGDLLHLRLVRNPGAAFGLAGGLTVVFTAVAVVVIVAILRVAPRLRSTGWSVGLGLLLGGATGNLTDRVFRDPAPFRGHVIDFLELPHWPVFNIADMAIVSAAGTMLLLSMRGVSIDGQVDDEDGRNGGDRTPHSESQPGAIRASRDREEHVEESRLGRDERDDGRGPDERSSDERRLGQPVRDDRGPDERSFGQRVRDERAGDGPA